MALLFSYLYIRIALLCYLMLTNMMNTENPLPQQAHTFVFQMGNQTKSAKKVVPFGLGLLHWIVVTLEMFC